MENTIIQASAGTGKTHQLACRYLLLLFSGVRPENILATTFTKKAAGEILDRILSWLAKGAIDKESCEQLSDNLSNAKKKTLLEDTKSINLKLDKVRSALYEVIKNLNRINISTLDSYFNQRAQCFSLELGLPMDWTIIDDSLDKRHRQMVLAEMFQDEEIVRRYVYCILKGNELKRSVFDQMSSIVDELYSLWREAPSEAWDALEAPESELDDDEFLKMLNAATTCLKESGIPQNAINDVDAIRNPVSRFNKVAEFLKKSLAINTWNYMADPEIGLSYSKKEISDPITIDCLEQLVDYAQTYIKFVMKMQSDFYRDTLKVFDDLYIKEKKDKGQLLFEDVPWFLIQNNASSQQLNDAQRLDANSFRMDSAIQHLMLDEFQDTSLIQWLVLQPLAQKTAKDENGSFFCVGDTKQAIYGWRGGEAHLLSDLKKLLKAPVNTVPMTESRRSGSAIMQAVNDVFLNIEKNQLIVNKSAKSNLQLQPSGVLEWRKRYSDHFSHESCKNLPSYVELRTAPYSPNASKEDMNDTSQLRLMTYEYTAQMIQDLVKQTKKQGLNLSIGVLVPKNVVGATIADCIKRLGLECSLEGTSPLLDSYEVCQILALLKWIDHPDDAYSFYQVSQSSLAESLGLKDKWKKSINHRNRLVVNYNDCRIINDLRNELFCSGYGLMIQRWADLLMLEADELSRRRLETLVELANKYDPQGSTRTDDFIDYINGADVSDAIQTQIRVMTYHKSKGLEFDIVVLPQLDAQLVKYDSIPVVYGRPNPIQPPDKIIRYIESKLRYFLPPDQQILFSIDEEKQKQEALCNLYVAMTRAKQGLYMILPPPKTGRSSYNKTYEDILLGCLTKLPQRTDKEPDTVYYTTGDPHWIQNTKPKQSDKISQNNKAETSDKTVEVKADFHFRSPKASVCIPLPATAWTTDAKPSSFVNVSSVEVKHLESRGSSLTQSTRGTLFHCWLADIEWLEDYRVDDQRLIDLGIGIGLQKDSFLDLLPLFKSLLKQPTVISNLKRPDNSWETHREKNVAAILSDPDNPGNAHLVNGVIDRLELHRANGKVDKAFILDYKTVQKGSELSSVRTRYAGQMDAYRQIVSKMYNIPVSSVETQLLILEGDF